MIKETSDSHGNFEKGSIHCDNEPCQKVLYEWFDKNNAPADNRGGFFTYSVKTRVIFNRIPTNFALSALNPSFVFSVQDKYIGYILDFDVLPLRLDFCSVDCSLAWLNNNTKYGIGLDFMPLSEKRYYGVIFYGENRQEQNQLVADNGTRFETIVIGNFLPTSAPKNQVKLPIGQQIDIAGNSFDVRASGVLYPGEKEPRIGIVMTTLMFKCPMKLDSPYRTCNQKLQVIVDLIPSVWVCPICKGIIVFDKGSNSLNHSHANLKSELSFGNMTVNANYYFGQLDWGNKKLINWVMNDIGTNIIAVADAYQDTGMFDNAFISASFVDLDDVVNLFGHLIS
ncbi:MAG: hypothetical protein JW963_21875 [Anaerolineales bacterium]|nr:hypothetical protein [Anaerolineales bacterium]